MEIALRAKDLEVRYGAVVGLAGVDFEIPVGSSLAVIGANGSGKSTLLSALARLRKPAAGELTTIDPAPALVLQSTEVADDLAITVRDTVRLARYPSVGLLRRFSAADHDAVHQALERMQVAHLASEALNQLSGGQRQRVLMAQGLAQQSRILLLDEPMTGLDITSRQLVLDVIAQEVAGERTVVMTTHSLSDASECDFALLLDTTLVAFGPPGEVFTEANLRRTFRDSVIEIGGELVVNDHHVH